MSAQQAGSLLRPGSFGLAPSYTREEGDLVEELPGYKSYINWSRGELITEYNVPITYQDPNVGRSVVNSSSRLKDELLVYASQALGQIKASAYLTLDDYFNRNEDVRNNLLQSLYGLSVKNAVIDKSQMKGSLAFPLYGAGSVSVPFYRNIKSGAVTNYIVRSTLENYYDTLIIDLVMFPGFSPSLMPRILNQKGELIHGVETVDLSVLQKQGPVHYVTSITKALAHPARGKKIAYIFPADLSGPKLSDIVLFDADVERLFSHQRSVNSYRAGNVIIIHAIGK